MVGYRERGRIKSLTKLSCAKKERDYISTARRNRGIPGMSKKKTEADSGTVLMDGKGRRAGMLRPTRRRERMQMHARREIRLPVADHQRKNMWSPTMSSPPPPSCLSCLSRWSGRFGASFSTFCRSRCHPQEATVELQRS
jgi:hypothetical protein